MYEDLDLELNNDISGDILNINSYYNNLFYCLILILGFFMILYFYFLIFIKEQNNINSI